MIAYLAPFLILALALALYWVLRQRSPTTLWRGHEYRTVLDSLEDAIMVYDKNAQPIYLNRAAREWFGLDEAESYETRPLRTQIAPVDTYLTLLSNGGRASFTIGPRQVEAVSQRVKVQGADQTTIVLHDVTASHELLVKERRRVSELDVFNKINQAINASLDLTELLDTILDKLRDLFPYTNTAISLWNSKTDQLIPTSHLGSLAAGNGASTLFQPYAQYLVDEHEPLLVSDVQQPGDITAGSLIRSYMGVPLMSGDKFIGTLELSSDRREAFTAENLETLCVLASQVAVAIENARLYNETLLRAEELAAMNKLSSALSTSINIGELLQVVVYSIKQAIDCDHSAIFLMDNERGVLRLANGWGLSEEFIRQHQNIKPQLGGPGQVVLDRYPLIVADVREAVQPPELVPLLEDEGIRAYADFPLRGREHVLGAMTVYYSQSHTFADSELALLGTFANQLTLALENARLYERTDRALARRVEQLAAIEEIGRELTSTLDLTGVFNLVIQRAMGSTGASAGLLALSSSDCEALELIVDRGYPPGTLDHLRVEGWPVEQGIVGRVACSGVAALINDVDTDLDYIAYLPDTNAKLVLPIKNETRVLGVIALESTRPQGFSQDDMRFTSQLAELAAIAIDNARLFQQVREGRDNLQAILDSSREGILVIDRDNRVVLANPMITQLSGLSTSELVGWRVSELVSDLGPRVARMLGYPVTRMAEALTLLDSASKQVSKRTFEMPERSRYIEQVASPVIDKDNMVVGRLIVFRDVTEERRLAKMRQDLTDMIIHDLRSPLTAVVGGVQVAKYLTVSSAEPDKIEHALDMAAESCNRLMSLVDSLLDISRLEAGEMPLKRAPLALPALAESVVQEMAPLAERDAVALQLQTIIDIPQVYADDELIRRVLVNLIDNAIKHSPRNGIVTIEVAPERVSDTPGAVTLAGGADEIDHPLAKVSDRRPPSVQCAVSDMGPGIPPELRERVFERFAQLDGRRTGKGLGLTFCKLAILAHGGRIWVEDTPNGKGSLFAFTLPVVPEQLLQAET